MKKTFQTYLLITLLLSLPASLPPAFAAEPTGLFEARQLWQLFKENQDKAGQDLIGKTIDIQGVVVETGMSVYLTPNVRLSNSAGGQIFVTCVLPRSDTGLLSTFNAGEKVTMRGRVYRFSSNEYVVIKESHRVTK